MREQKKIEKHQNVLPFPLSKQKTKFTFSFYFNIST